jgi:hypothetical protein
MTETIAIRKKVAALCGFTDINWYSEPFHALLKGFKFGLQVPVPKYDTSLDAIIEAFDERGLTWTLEKRLDEEHDEIVYFALSGKHHGFSNRSNGAAMAMCYLFIELMEANKKALQ